MEYVIALMLLFIRVIFGKLVLKQSSKNYDKNLFIVAVIFFILGSKTVVFGGGHFSIML